MDEKGHRIITGFPFAPRSRRARHQAYIRQIAVGAPDDLTALQRLFEDDRLDDDGTLAGRLRALLEATDRRSIPGLQTAIRFGDRGFAGDRRPGGAGFKDPWPSSRNQVGHFLTAVRLQFAPEVVRRPIPVLGSIRAIVGAPEDMDDAEVAVRLAIGHEKATDPRTPLAAIGRSLAGGALGGLVAALLGARRGTSGRAFLLALGASTWWQARDILAAFRAQFAATTDADLAAWRQALDLSGDGSGFDPRALAPGGPLYRIRVGSGEGNSVQDLRLTLVGWRLGQLIGSGMLPDRQAAALWIRRALAEHPDRAPAAGAGPMARSAPRRTGRGLKLLVDLAVDSPHTHAVVTLLTSLLPAARVQITRHELDVAHLPAHLDGLRLLHLSDLHLHPGSGLAWQLPELVADLPHDLICYTGDFIDEDSDLPQLQILLERMPRSPAYAVLGNHDYIPLGRADKPGANDTVRLQSILSGAGIHVLLNTAVSLHGGALWLAGVDDPITGRASVGRAYSAVPTGACSVLLAHSPDIILRLHGRRPGLVLAGHTHGGQIRLPLLGMLLTLSELPRRYVQGLVTYEGMPMFVSRGIGYSGLHVRIGSPAEVALLTLRSPARLPHPSRQETVQPEV
jgi:predicted MPP superfamily phosphohydrolase